MSDQPGSGPRVVIVGGGYAGTRLAQALDNMMDVVLIERRDKFVHNVAAIRAVVDPAWRNAVAHGYDRLLDRGSVTRGNVVDVHPGGVVMDDGRTLEAKFVVLCPGSSYATPFKPKADEDASAFLDRLAAVQRQLAEAAAVAIVGAGPVGTELAGEIRHYFPNLVVTLIGSEDRLLPGYAGALDRRLQRDLARAGVALRLGRRAIDLPSTVEPYGLATLKLDDGTALTDCLVFRTGGAQPNTAWLEKRDGVRLERGRIVVGDHLELEGLPGTFALGDAALTKDTMTISAIERQIPYLNKLLRRLARGEPLAKQAPYKAWASPVIVVPVGPRHGATQLPLALVAGGWLTSRLKGRHLLVDKTRHGLGLTTNEEHAHV